MSFASALPANLPKFQILIPFRRELDVASGYENVTSLIRILADSAVAYDVYMPIRSYTEYGTGYDVHEPVEILILLRELDVADGLEYLTRDVRVSDSPATILEVVGRVDRQLPPEVANAVELLSKIATVSDFGVGRYAVPRRQFFAREPAVARDRYALARKYDAVLRGLELFTVSYPISVSPIRDAEDAYLHASQQLSTLQSGRYAYAQDWNVLADYAKSVLNIMLDGYRRLYKNEYRYYIDTYDKVLECHRILSMYRYLRTGDVIMPDHTNTLIDVVRCLDETIRRLTLTKEIVMVNTDDWDVAKKYVSDGTIIFVNYGTQAMTPEEVRRIVDTMKVVFAVLIDEQPYYRVDVGAFYDVFYTTRVPHRYGGLNACVTSHIEKFRIHAGFCGCFYPSCTPSPLLYATWDARICDEHKVPFIENWEYPVCSWAFARYRVGAIIEMPYDATWYSANSLDWSIGMIIHMLLGEPNACHISTRTIRQYRVVWMASYTSNAPSRHICHPADQCLRELASRCGIRIIDLRTR